MGGSASGGGGSSSVGGAGAGGGAGMGSGCDPLPSVGSGATTVTPAQTAQLRSLLYDAQPGDVFLLEDGNYDLGGDTLQLIADGVTVRGKSGDRSAVVIDNNYQGGSIFAVGASNVTIADLTIRRAFYHPIHVSPAGGQSITGVQIYNVRIVDPGEQAIKINTGANFTAFADSGTIACSHLEMTAAGRSQVRNNCYTGGVDAHQARNWTIRDNRVEGFWCDAGLSEHGIHLWRGARDTVIERNVLVNNARGIGLGLGNDNVGRDYSDAPCGGNKAQHYGGVVRNNFIYADDAALFASASGFDAGIGLESACDATVVHNTVFSTTAPFAAIDVRFSLTSGLVANNLLSHPVVERGGPSATVSDNVDGAQPEWFVDAASANLHLAPSASGAIDQANAGHSTQAPTDIDGESRASAPDVGADEL